MKLSLSAFIVIFSLLLPSVAKSYLPCDSSSNSYFYEANKLTNFPPLNSGMPYDVMLGYIVADSVLKTAKLFQIKDFINRQDNVIFSDSLKYFLKYFYKLSDYNPIIFEQYSMECPDNYIFPNIIKSQLAYFFNNNLDSGDQYNYLINSSYILHVTINDTLKILNRSDEDVCEFITAISANVLDTIKGQNIPNIQVNPNMIEHKKITDKLQSGIGATFVFQYCNDWPLSMGNETLDNYIIPNKEYIIFLDIRTLCYLSGKAYLTITPYAFDNMSSSMYPIENNIVFDSGNTWGLGNHVPVQQFKDKIRAYISNIENFGE